MVNTELLEERINASGLMNNYIAKQCSITPQALRRKILGKNEFTASQILVISKLLRLTWAEVRQIFFAENVSKTETKGET